MFRCFALLAFLSLFSLHVDISFGVRGTPICSNLSSLGCCYCSAALSAFFENLEASMAIVEWQIFTFAVG